MPSTKPSQHGTRGECACVLQASRSDPPHSRRGQGWLAGGRDPVDSLTGQTFAIVEHYAANVNRSKLGKAAMLKFDRKTNV